MAATIPTFEGGNIPEAPRESGIIRADFRGTEGGVEFEAISKLAETVGNVALVTAQNSAKMKNEADNSLVLSKFTEADKRIRQKMYVEPGNLNLREGENALDIYNEADTFMKDTYKDITTGMLPEQLGKFNQLWVSKDKSVRDTVSKWQGTKTKTYNASVLNGVIGNELANVQINFNNSDDVDISIARSIVATEALGEQQGIPSEQVEVDKKAVVSEIRKTVIESMAEDNAGAAKVYYDAFKKEITGEDRKYLDELVGNAVFKVDVRGKADKIQDKNGDDLKAQLLDVDKIKDEDLRASTKKLVTNEFSQNEKIRKMTDEAMVTESWQSLEVALDEGNIEKATEIADNIEDRKSREAMNKEIDRFSQGQPRETDWSVDTELKLMTKKELAEINPLDFRSDLADPEYKVLQNMVQDAKGLSKGGKTTTLTKSKIAQNKITEAITGLDIDLTSDKGKEALNVFWNSLSALEEGQDRLATTDDVKDIIDGMFISGEIKGTIFRDPDRLLFQVKPGEEFFTDDIPRKEMGQIREAYQDAFNREPTEEEALRAYQKFQEGQIK